MSNIEKFEKYWYKPLYDSMKFDGNPDKDLFRYKDLGKQPALLSWIECSRLKDAIILDLQAERKEVVELEKKLEIAIEALSLIGGPVEFYCEVGEANKQSAASEALAKIKGEEVGG